METKLVNIDFIEKVIGYTFNDKSLLETAFTHPSYANEHIAESYERLEFLGDTVAKCVIADELYDRYPKAREGDLTLMKKDIESNSSLAKTFSATGLADLVKFGKNSTDTIKLYAKLFEAIAGAIFLDSGKNLDVARRFVLYFLEGAINTAKPTKAYNQRLNECKGLKYKFVCEEDKDAKPSDRWIAILIVDGVEKSRGSGPNKKEAEEVAAKQFFVD